MFQSGPSRRKTTASLFRIIVGMLLILSFLQSGAAVSIFKLYPLANDYFEIIYQIKDNQATRFMTISCKQKNMISLSISQGLNFMEAPRFGIYGRDNNVPQLATDAYTFLSQCNFNAEVNTSNFVQIRRAGSKQIVFAIKDVSLTKDLTQFKVVDKSVKWGLGERFQRKFHITDGKWTIWNRDKPWRIDNGNDGVSHQTYGHQPIYLARETLGKLYHISYFKNTHGLLYQSLQNSNLLKFNTLSGSIHFILILGQQNPEPLLEKYHNYIGNAHVPPFWSMGFHQCRWGYPNLAALETVVSKYNQNALPLDTVWSDLDYMDRKMIFTVNQHTYPPARLNSLLQTQSLHYIPLIDVGVSIHDSVAMQVGKTKNVFLKSLVNPRQDYLAQVWPGQVHFVDYLHPNATQFWESQLDRLYQKIKFSGIWLDMNEPSNFRGGEQANQPLRIQQNQGINSMTINVDLKHYSQSSQRLYHKQVHAYFGHLSAVATHQYLKRHGRPFIISRSNSVGTGRFAGHWTGDNVATWDFLRLSISGNFLFQIFGIQMVGADICGFHQHTNEQLCARWMQLGSLYPFARNHNEDVARSQQPYSFGQQLTKTSQLSLKTRYALLKQMYTTLLIKNGTGSFFRPIFFEFFSDQRSYDIEAAQTQFLIGSYLLSAPIVNHMEDVRDVYFPGKDEVWYQCIIDPETGQANSKQIKYYKGGQMQEIKNILPSAPPIFLRSGYMILTNKPELRSVRLSNKFHLFAGLDKQSSVGKILAVKNYSDDSQIDKCVLERCELSLVISRSQAGSFSLEWKYEGLQANFGQIIISSVIVVRQSTVWKRDKQIVVSARSGKMQLVI